MDEADSKKLDRILELAEENNQYIRKVRSTQKTSQMFKAIYWVIILTFVFGGFLFIKPYISAVKDVYASFSGGNKEGGTSFQLSDIKNLQGLIDQLKQYNKSNSYIITLLIA